MSTVKDLREIAKTRGIKGYSKMKKAELCEKLNMGDDCKGKAAVPPVTGLRKVKINKPKCVGGTLQWIVGSGCYDSSPKTKPSSPKTKPSSPKTKPSSPKASENFITVDKFDFKGTNWVGVEDNTEEDIDFLQFEKKGDKKRYIDCVKDTRKLDQNFIESLNSYAYGEQYYDINNEIQKNKGEISRTTAQKGTSTLKKAYNILLGLKKYGIVAARDFTVYRSVAYQADEDEIPEEVLEMANAKIGTTNIIHRAISTTSAKENESIFDSGEEYRLEILVKKGSRYLCPHFSQEAEIILGPGKLTKLKNNDEMGVWRYENVA
jgi:hypothetical protein